MPAGTGHGGAERHDRGTGRRLCRHARGAGVRHGRLVGRGAGARRRQGRGPRRARRRGVAAARAKLGESLASVRAMDVPLARATTASFDALKAYSLAEASRVSGVDDNDAIALYRRAARARPRLRAGACAPRHGAVEPRRRRREHPASAARLRAARPRQRIRAALHHLRTTTATSPTRCRSISKSLRVWQRTFPNDFTAPNNLAVIHLQLGDYAAARDAARDALRLAPRHVLPRLNLGWALLFNGELAEASATAGRTRSTPTRLRLPREVPAWSAYFRGDAAELERRADRAGGRSAAAGCAPSGGSRRGICSDRARLEADALWTALGDRDRQAGRQEAEILARDQAGPPARDRRSARAGPRRRHAPRSPWSARRGRRSNSDSRWSTPATSRARGPGSRGCARPRPTARSSTSSRFRRCEAALALRERQPERASRRSRPVGSLDLSYTASALYLRTRALREAGRFRDAMAEAERRLARPWLLGLQGIGPRAGAGVRARGGRRGRVSRGRAGDLRASPRRCGAKPTPTSRCCGRCAPSWPRLGS